MLKGHLTILKLKVIVIICFCVDEQQIMRALLS